MDPVRTRAAYDLVAQVYEDRFLHELVGKPRDRELLDELAARGTGAVVDIGCGPGQIGAYVRARGRTVVGVDLSPVMAGMASRRLDGAAAGTILALPLATGSMAAAVAFYSLIHLPRRSLVPAFVELGRVLHPGGQLLVAAHEGAGEVGITEFLGHAVELEASLYALDELTTAATAAGLRVARAERRPPYETEGTTTRLYVEAVRPNGPLTV